MGKKLSNKELVARRKKIKECRLAKRSAHLKLLLEKIKIPGIGIQEVWEPPYSEEEKELIAFNGFRLKPTFEEKIKALQQQERNRRVILFGEDYVKRHEFQKGGDGTDGYLPQACRETGQHKLMSLRLTAV